MKILAVLLTAAALTFAQEKGAPPKPVPLPVGPGETIRIVDVKQANASIIEDSLGSLFPGITRVGNQLIVRGEPAVADMIEAAIKKLDVAPPKPAPPPPAGPSYPSGVEFTMHLLLGSVKEIPEAKLPADLESTVRQLSTVFPYKGYRVLDAQIFRTARGKSVEMSGVLPGSKSTFQLKVEVGTWSFQVPRTIYLSRLSFGLQQQVPPESGGGTVNGGIITSLDAREGQKTVVGKANLSNSEDAIILVITPKVIE